MSEQLNVRQLCNRLENATNSSERIDTLRSLKGIARTNALEVGKHSLQRILELLKEQSIPEEYEEALELLNRLVKTKDPVAAASNTAMILSDISNVELLLDLLEHADPVVGVMTSEILTQIHSVSGGSLELAIQECPAGMNKLLQRLPDSSREEVRNQALLLVQQLTASNEEMKKTVAFNEGFDILFGIIRSEGGASDPSLVVQDCLRICSNILSESETCQRLFYGMGGSWHQQLLEFFDPTNLENAKTTGNLAAFGLEDEEEDTHMDRDSPWFLQQIRLGCAVLAINALVDSQVLPNGKHQKVIGLDTTAFISAAAFWLARLGPLELARPALSLLESLVRDNANVSANISSTMIRIAPPRRGKDVPSNVDVLLSFGWRPLPTDERRFITVPTLLADRYVFGGQVWAAADTAMEVNGQDTTVILNQNKISDSQDADAIPVGCLRVLEGVLAADSTTSGLVMQHILAPPPPPPDDETNGSLETMRPFGSVILNTLVEGCSKVLLSQSGAGVGMLNQSARNDVITAAKCANILALVFIHGGQLAREISTAISTSHTSLAAGRGGPVATALPHQPLLPFLLSTANSAARIQGGGYSLTVAILRMLAVAATGCERAVRLMLEDPSNLFVVDLATPASEGAGVPPAVQIMSCLFLGCCLNALPHSSEASSSGGSAGKNASRSQMEDNSLTQRSMIAMIDGRIGLTRFTDLLRRPAGKSGPLGLDGEVFFCQSFRSFYETQTVSIRQSLFDFYSSGTAGGDSPEQQIIAIQKDVIAKLEEQIRSLSTNGTPALGTPSPSKEPVTESSFESQYAEELQYARQDLALMREEFDHREQVIREYEITITELRNNEIKLLSDLEGVRLRAEAAEMKLQQVMDEHILMQHDDSTQLSALKSRLIEQEAMYAQLEEDLRASESRALAAESEQAKVEVEIQRFTTQQRQSEEALNAQIISLQQALDKALSNGTAENSSLVEQLQLERARLQEADGLTRSLQDQNLSLKEMIIDNDNKMRSDTEEINLLKRRIQLLEEELKAPLAEQQMNIQKIVNLEDRNVKLTQQIWQLESDLQSAQSKAENADASAGLLEAHNDEIESLRQALDAVRGELEISRGDCVKLDVDADSLRIEIAALKDENNQLNEEQFKLSEHAELLRTQLDETLSAKSVVEEDLSSLRSEFEQRCAEFDTLKATLSEEIKRLSEDLDTVKHERDIVSSSQASIESLQEELQSLRTNMNLALQEKHELQSQLDQEVIRSQSLVKELDLLQEEKITLNAELMNLKADFNKELAESGEKITYLESENENLHQALSEFREEASGQWETYKLKTEELESQLSWSQSEIERLERDRDEAQSALDELKSRFEDEVAAKEKELKEVIDGSERLRMELQQRELVLREELNNSLNETNIIKATLEETQQQLLALKASSLDTEESLQREITSLRNALDASSTSLSSSDEDKLHLKTALEELEVVKQQLTTTSLELSELQMTEKLLREEVHQEKMKHHHNTAGLPDGWMAVLDPSTKRPYFINTTTNQSQWEKPVEEDMSALEKDEGTQTPSNSNDDDFATKLKQALVDHEQVEATLRIRVGEFEALLVEKEKEIEASLHSYEEFREDSERIQLENNELRVQLEVYDALKQRYQELEQILENSERENKNLKSEIENLTAQKESFEGKLQEMTIELDTYRNQSMLSANEVEFRIQDYKTRDDALVEEAQRLREQLEQISQRAEVDIEGYKDEIMSLKVLVSHKDASVTELEERVANLETRSKEQTSSLLTAESEIQRMKLELETKDFEVKEREDGLKEDLKQAEQVKLDLQREVQRLVESEKSSRSRIEFLEMSIETARAVSEEVVSVQSEALLQLERDKTVESLGIISQLNDRISELVALVASKESDLNKLQAALDDQNKDFSDLQSQVDRWASLEGDFVTQINTLERALEDTRQELLQNQSALSTSKERIADLETQIESSGPKTLETGSGAGVSPISIEVDEATMKDTLSSLMTFLASRSSSLGVNLQESLETSSDLDMGLEDCRSEFEKALNSFVDIVRQAVCSVSAEAISSSAELGSSLAFQNEDGTIPRLLEILPLYSNALKKANDISTETRLQAEQQTIAAYTHQLKSLAATERKLCNQISDLENELVDTKTKLHSRDLEYESAKEDINKKISEIQVLTAEVKRLTSLISHEGSGLEDIRRELVEAKKENDDLRRRSGKHRVRSPQSTPYSTPKRGDSGQGELTKLFQDFEVIQKQLELERESSARAETIIKQKSQEIDALKKGLISRQSSVESSHEFEEEIIPGSDGWHQRQIDRLMKEISNLRQENDELQARVPVVVTQKPENERLVDALETIDKLRLEVASAHSKLQLERMGAARLQEELAEARAELDIDASLREAPVFPAKANLAASVLGDAMDGAGGMGSVFIAERDQLFRDNKKLREKLDQRTREIELVRADVKISEEIRHKASLHNLMEELAAAKARIDELVEMLEKQDSASDQVARVEAERDAYRKEVDDLLGEQKALHRRVVEAEERVGQHVSDMQVLRMNLQLVQQERDAHRLERESIQRQLVEREAKIQEMLKAIEAKELEVASGIVAQDKIKLELATAASRSALVEQKMVESQETSSGVISGLLKKVEVMTGQLRESSLRLSEMEEYQKRTDEESASLHLEIVRLKQRLQDNDLVRQQELNAAAVAKTEESISTARKIAQLESDLSHFRAERAEFISRIDTASLRTEGLERKVTERDVEISLLQNQLRVEQSNSKAVAASASQIRASELSQISRALQKELVHQTTMMEQKFHVSVVSAEARISRLQRRFFSFVAGIRVQKKERAQTRHLERLLQHNQQELVSNKQANDDAIAAIRELLEWMRSLRYSGAGADYIAVLDTDLTALVAPGSSPGSSISYNRLPSLIRQAKKQLQTVINAQHDIIQDTRRSVWEKEVALQEAEAQLQFSNAVGRYGSGSPDATGYSRTPGTGYSGVSRLQTIGYDMGTGPVSSARDRSASRPGSAGSRERPRSAGSRSNISPTPGYGLGTNGVVGSRYSASSRYGEGRDRSGRDRSAERLRERDRDLERERELATRDINRIQRELKAERMKLTELQEQHADLLALLAQQELELTALKDALLSAAGPEAVELALARAKRSAKSKYGAYVDFRGSSSLTDH